MAEGLIHAREGKQMEDLGSEYFRYMLTRSFFQQVTRDGSRFVMHEFINDLAQSVGGDVYFRMGDGFGQQISERARHLTYWGGEMFEGFSELTCLRTFLHLMPPEQGGGRFNYNFPLQLSKLLRLRVLSLSGYHIIQLPKSISDLKHLRYLDHSNNSIESMPESTTTLYNLQTLILENCPALKKLHSMFRNLVNLCHLNI
jgi:Leucine-rich repeat (LRR) protein